MAKTISPHAGVRTAQTQETREKILSSALKAFSEKGFDGASLRNIATDAGLNHALIKYHFTNKEELWKAAVDFLFARINEEMAEPDAHRRKSNRERVRLWIHRYVRYCANYPEHGRIMVQESIRDSERLQWMAENHIRDNHKLLLSTLPRTLDLSRFPDVDLPMLIYMINSATQTPFTLAAEIRHLYDIEVNDADFVERYAEGIFNVFFRPYFRKKTS